VRVHRVAKLSRGSGLQLSHRNVDPASIKAREVWVEPFDPEVAAGKLLGGEVSVSDVEGASPFDIASVVGLHPLRQKSGAAIG